MFPERCRPTSADSPIERLRDRFNTLNEVFTQQETTFSHDRTATDPAIDVRSVFVVEWESDLCINGILPGSFELLSPRSTLAETACSVQADIEFSVICGKEFLD